MTDTPKTLDLTPTWAGILPALILLLECGDHEARSRARKELARMAEIADKYVSGKKS